MKSRAAYITAATPMLGSVLLVALAVAQAHWFNTIVREDSLLEWAEVSAFGVAAVLSARVAYRTDGFVRVAYGLLAVATLAAVGEELSWGQRLFHVTTPETLATSNRQHELNVHNLFEVESTDVVLLAVAICGAMLPLLRPPGPFVPPRALVPAFAVVAVYFGIRFLFLSEPTYVQAKFSEWPEFCFAAAVALTAHNTLSRSRPGAAPERA